MVKPGRPSPRKAAEALAVQALSFIAADTQRLGTFLAATGIGPERIRAAAAEPNFLAGVLDHLAADDKLLMAFAADAGIEPAQIARARAALGTTMWERETP
jgi:LPS sulfotransferase NodH